MLNTILKFLMPAKLKNFLLKIRDFLKGKKTYIAALILLLQALMGYLDAAVSLNNFADLASFLQNLPTSEATSLLVEALALFGLRASIKKKQS